MKLTFDASLVQRLREHAQNASDHRLSYGQEKKEPGLWLVGDQGVYLMSNGSPVLNKDADGKSSIVAYANECNPETMPFEDWWDIKRRSFGGDDGVEFIPLASIPESGRIVIDISADQFAILEVV